MFKSEFSTQNQMDKGSSTCGPRATSGSLDHEQWLLINKKKEPLFFIKKKGFCTATNVLNMNIIYSLSFSSFPVFSLNNFHRVIINVSVTFFLLLS